MSVGVIKDRESSDHVDYVFMADVWGKDPRCVDRFMLVALHRGLFRDLRLQPLGVALERLTVLFAAIHIPQAHCPIGAG